MTSACWIVLERSGNWAAALRQEIATCRELSAQPPRVFEARSFDEVDAQLSARGDSFLLLEVRRSNLAESLQWISDNRMRRRPFHVVALLNGQHQELDDDDLAAVVGAICSAGCDMIADSPRRLRHVVGLGARLFQVQQNTKLKQADDIPFREWAWSQLPWQDA